MQSISTNTYKEKRLPKMLNEIFIPSRKIVRNGVKVWSHNLQPGDLVRVVGNAIINCFDKPTHCITTLWGKDERGYLSVTVMSLVNGELGLITFKN